MTQEKRPCCNNKLTGFSIGVNFGSSDNKTEKEVESTKNNKNDSQKTAEIIRTALERHEISKDFEVSPPKKLEKSSRHSSKHSSNNSINKENKENKKTNETKPITKCQQEAFASYIQKYLKNLQLNKIRSRSASATTRKCNDNLRQRSANYYVPYYTNACPNYILFAT